MTENISSKGLELLLNDRLVVLIILPVWGGKRSFNSLCGFSEEFWQRMKQTVVKIRNLR